MDNITLPDGLTVPQGMKYWELPAGEEGIEFWGRFIDEVDTDNGGLRWAQLKLFKILDTNPEHDSKCPEEENRGMYGKELWFLYTIGHTLVVHGLDSSCNRGVRSKISGFPAVNTDHADLEECPDCTPAVDWDADGEYRIEITWYSDTTCQSADKVIRSLYRAPSCKNCRDRPHEGVRCRSCGCTDYAEAPRMLSIPGRRLIEQVKKVDPEIAKAAARTRKL